jgi:hypothetical protein
LSSSDSDNLIPEFDGPRLASGESREFLELWFALEARRGKAWMNRRFPFDTTPRDTLEALREATVGEDDPIVTCEGYGADPRTLPD